MPPRASSGVRGSSKDRDWTRRNEQAGAVARIVDSWWKAERYHGNFVVLGDLNDYPGRGTALGSLLNHKALVNVVQRLPANDRWTHHYAQGGRYQQLDYLLLSKALADANPHPPEIMRKGMAYRVARYERQRFEEVGENHPKASDHAPVWMEVELL